MLDADGSAPIRAQGAYVSEEDVERVIDHWQRADILEKEKLRESAPWEEFMDSEEDGPDSLIEQAVEIIQQSGRASTSMLQRRLKIGYPRAARLMEELEVLGVVGSSQGGGRERDVLATPEEPESKPKKSEDNESDDGWL